jgi:hypothetical protein
MSENKPLAEVGSNAGLGLSSERTKRLRELAAEGVALHNEGQPEREVCDGLLLALVEIHWLRAELLREHADHKETLEDVDSLVAAERERWAAEVENLRAGIRELVAASGAPTCGPSAKLTGAVRRPVE